MNPDSYTLMREIDKIYPALPQKLLSWSRNALRWVDEPGLNILAVRYMDMGFLFGRLQAQEAEHGSREKQPNAKSFFCSGSAGS